MPGLCTTFHAARLVAWFWNAKCALTVSDVNEFDDRQESRRTQAARAMLSHTRIEHESEPVGGPMPKALESWV